MIVLLITNLTISVCIVKKLASFLSNILKFNFKFMYLTLHLRVRLIRVSWDSNYNRTLRANLSLVFWIFFLKDKCLKFVVCSGINIVRWWHDPYFQIYVFFSLFFPLDLTIKSLFDELIFFSLDLTIKSPFDELMSYIKTWS